MNVQEHWTTNTVTIDIHIPIQRIMHLAVIKPQTLSLKAKAVWENSDRM